MSTKTKNNINTQGVELADYLPNNRDAQEFEALVYEYDIPYTLWRGLIYFASVDLRDAGKQIWRDYVGFEPTEGFYRLTYFLRKMEELGYDTSDAVKIKQPLLDEFKSVYGDQHHNFRLHGARASIVLLGWKTSLMYFREIFRMGGIEGDIQSSLQRQEEPTEVSEVSWEASSGLNFELLDRDTLEQDPIIKLRVQQLELGKRYEQKYQQLKTEIQKLNEQ